MDRERDRERLRDRGRMRDRDNTKAQRETGGREIQREKKERKYSKKTE